MKSQGKGLPIALVVVAGIVFLFNLGGTQLWDDDEPKNAGCGREMLERGDWIVPTFNDLLRPHKPVLSYWPMIASYKLVGVSEFGARLPSAIAGIGTVLLCFYIGRILFDRMVGFGAAVLLASGLMFAALSRAATPDAVLILCTTAAYFCFVYGIASLRGGHFCGATPEQRDVSLEDFRLPLKPALGMYAAIGLAVLAKGPIGVMLPVSVITFYAVLFNGHATAQHASDSTSRWQSMWLTTCALLAPQRLWRIAGGLRAVLGAATVAAVALPWYVAVTYATEGEWLTGFLGTHNVHRFLHPMEGHSGPIFYYVIAILAGFFPGSCFLPVAIVSAMRDKRKRAPLAHSQAFLLCWVGCYLVFFSLAATKLPNYIVPCYPALALLTGYWLVSALRTSSPPRFWLRMGMGSLALVGLALAIGLGTASVMFMDGNLTVSIAGVIPLVGGIVSLVYLHKENHQRALLSFAATSVLFTVVATGIAAPRISPYQTSPRIAHHLSEIESASVAADVQFATFRYTKPNIVFYLGRAIPGLVSEDEAVKLLSDNTNSFLVLPETEFDKLRSRLPAEVAVIHNEPKFFKPAERIVVVGRHAQLTRRWAGNTTITK